MDPPENFRGKFSPDSSEFIASVLTEDHFRCSVCTEVLKDPVSIPCGHSYCRQCKMQANRAGGHYACPICKKRLKTKPKIYTNSPISKQLPSSSSECGQLSCDFCPVKKLRAVKFCLMYTALYCETHVIQHYTVPALQRHRLVEPTEHLEQMICQHHQRALEMFCRTDQTTICSMCAVLKHRHHDIMIENLEQKGPSSEHRGGEPKCKAKETQQQAEEKNVKKHIHLQKGERPLVTVIQHQRRHALPAKVTLDFYTAHRRLILSDDKRNVKLSGCPRSSHNQQHGLGGQPFVLGRKGFTSGRRFWQVGVNNRWTIGVTRASAQRTDSVTFYPNQGYWCLSCWMQFLVLTSPIHHLPKDAVPRELGICLDIDEKWVSFYNAESKTHIYTFADMDFKVKKSTPCSAHRMKRKRLK
ncbi:E3 ubiquitin-protein ligase TRIM39-like [Alosa alosa]|uniref:E3 ubiquitin-protein ligase TRIM39-like n=1 Tax=Alosa alosa TaxID=278164 RepID=UPI00201554A1|nr:E3 ubiquitin-protein ligase TRIM39-like [Alosa alosa]